MRYEIISLVNFSAFFEQTTLNTEGISILMSVNSNGLVLILEFETDGELIYDSHIVRNMQTIMNKALPAINQELLNKKYLYAHVLIDTISILDIIKIGIRKLNEDKYISFDKPFVMEAFPPLVAEQNIDEIFIRDYIDCMTSYYKFNLDDCIRKAITSLENYYSYLGISGDDINLTFYNNRPSFISKTEELLRKPNSFIMPCNVINSVFKSIWIGYKIRNCIVHNKYRLEQGERWVCNRIIHSLYNVYNNNLNPQKEISKYIIHIHMQFGFIDSLLSYKKFFDNIDFSDEETKYLCQKFNLTLPSNIELF